MKKRNIFSLLLVLALLLGTARPALAADTAATMQLSATEGTVTVTNATGRGLSLRSNMRLYSGYQVETSAKSYAWISLDDSKLIKLDANSKAEIRKSGKKLEVLLKSGNLYGNVSKPLEADETLDVRTSTAIVGIRGTKFSVAQLRAARQNPQEMAAERWITRVQVYEGTVAVQTQQETPAAPGAPEAATAIVTTTITAGKQLTVDPAAERETEVFTETPLAAEDISGSAAVELAQEPEPLKELGIDLSPESARGLLERDQAQAEEKQAEADAAKTGLETEAAPNIVWDGASETPSGGGSGESGGGSTTTPDPTPDPTPTPDPDPSPAYTVTFDPNGGLFGNDKTPQSVTTEPGGLLASASVPADPALDGYTFAGWYTAASGGTAADLTAAFTANTTLYAQWTALPAYTVTFDPNGGLFGNDKTPQYVTTEPGGQLASDSVPADPALGGCTFAGWNTAADGSGTSISQDALNTYKFTEDTTLYAQWTALPAYTVTFDPNGGTWDGTDKTPQSVTTEPGGQLAPDSAPAATRAANTDATAVYTFAGWNTAADGSGTTIDPASYTFTADASLYAQWTMGSGWDWALNSGALRIFGSGIVMESVSNPPWGDSVSTITSVTVEEGITGIGQMVFVGCSSLPSIVLPQSLTSIGAYAFQDCTLLESVTFSGTPTFEKTGLGAFAFMKCTALTSFTVPSGVTEVQQYTFSGCTSLTTVDIPASATAVSTEAFDGCTGLTDITFGGTKAQWNDFRCKTSDDVTVTCSDGILPEYVVTFDLNGGTGTAPDQTVDKGGTATKPADPTRSGYIFGGWSLDSTTAYDFSTPVTGNITLTALWKQIYTITLNPDGGTWADGSTGTKTFQTGYDGKITEIPAEPTRDGYAMMWYDDGGVMCDLDSVFTGDVTLTARWKDARQVIFSPEGGTWADGTTTSKTLYTDWYNNVYPPALTREGYTLSGWRRDSGMGDLISPDQISSTQFTAADLLHAEWVQTT